VQPLQYLAHRLVHLLLVHRFSLRATTYCNRTRWSADGRRTGRYGNRVETAPAKLRLKLCHLWERPAAEWRSKISKDPFRLT